MTATAPDSAAPAVYEARGLVKEFDGGQVAALRGVDLTVLQGEFVAVTGPSGCGKSTLLQMLGALDRPTGGTLMYRGNSLPDIRDPAAYRAREIGFIFQAFHLLPTFTVLENVQIPMFEGGLARAQRRQRAIELLESVGLGHRLAHLPSQLSGGERQRVAIARSLANQPGVLLADEPTGNLDSANAAQVMDLILRLYGDLGMTLLLVTHDPGIAGLAGRAIRMKDGRVVPESPAAADTP